MDDLVERGADGRGDTGWLWPRVEQIWPEVKSRIRLPEAVSTHAPSARAIGSGANDPA